MQERYFGSVPIQEWESASYDGILTYRVNNNVQSIIGQPISKPLRLHFHFLAPHSGDYISTYESLGDILKQYPSQSKALRRVELSLGHWSDHAFSAPKISKYINPLAL